MAENPSFDLDRRGRAIVEAAIASGRYSSASHVIRAALLVLEERENRLATVRQELIAGELSGEPTPIDFDDFFTQKNGPGLTSKGEIGRIGRVVAPGVGRKTDGRGGYPAGPKPATGVPPVPQGLRQSRNQQPTA